MKTTTAAPISIRASGARYATRCVAHVAGTFAVNAAVLLAGLRLTGLSWSELCFLVLPPMMAGSGAVLTFLALNHMVLQSEAADAAIDGSSVFVHSRTGQRSGQGCDRSR
ncbi:hypothetical protein [Mycobacterium malmoense]|uniref:hypothetical protein n=1 Tax=Mycobacterium malmoense TaxID=1780 RepID=UPI00112FF8C0|nr:hypothetical protein [Mycobacterium malmoense]